MPLLPEDENARSVHTPVLLEEALNGLSLSEEGVYVDGTLGGGGHATAIASALGERGRVIGLDRDPAAVARAATQLPSSIQAIHSNYCDLPEVLADLNIKAIDGVLLVLGLSSDQLADRRRGFSFDSEGEVDLRFDPTSGEPAYRLLQRLSAEHLADIIYHYGEERYSRRIARSIVNTRRKSPIRTARELAEVVRRATPSKKGRQRIDPATRTFQALRIAVNDELKSLEIFLRRAPSLLKIGGRMVIISFHSLEDRRVKNAFRESPDLEIITRKPVQATPGECRVNPRCRSAKLRIAEKRGNDTTD
jgi:16S rRNA (cytosine1402-N4)-methyltransferase